MAFKQGHTIGSYRIIRLLGEGGMGAVYEVEHEKLGVRYALKTFVLSDGNAEMFRTRFQAEGRILARLNHPGIIRVFDLDVDSRTGVLYYVMDLILYKDGYAYTLADLEQGGADEEQLLVWFGQLCHSLAYVHSQGVVHRDIKLNTILISPEKNVVLADFGISKVCDEKLRVDVEVPKTFMTINGTSKIVVGTSGYMAPEVLEGGEITPAADVYSLGVVFFKLLTGVWYEPEMAHGEHTAIRLLDHFEHPWAKIIPAMLNEDPRKRPLNLVVLYNLLSFGCPSITKTAEDKRKKMKLVWGVVTGMLLLTVLSVCLFEMIASSSVKSPDNDDIVNAFNVPETLQ